MPPLINFLYDLNHTVQTGVLNDGVENLSWTAARLFDGTIVKQTLDWNIVLDIIMFIGAFLELHFVGETFRKDPTNVANIVIAIICLGAMGFVWNKRTSLFHSSSRHFTVCLRTHNHNHP